MTNPILQFRVYPEWKSLYFTVKIWPSLAALRKANPGNARTVGLCAPYLRMRVYGKRDKRSDRILPDMGCVHLSRNRLGTGIISHEFCHASIEWAFRKKLDMNFEGVKDGLFQQLPRHCPEEQFCHALSNMVQQCVARLYKEKIL